MNELTHTENKNQKEHAHHGPTYGTFIMVWLGLVGLTSITVSVAGFHLGPFTVVMALMIASFKTMLVVNYFMHLKWEMLIFKVFLGVCVIVFNIFVILTFSDYSYR